MAPSVHLGPKNIVRIERLAGVDALVVVQLLPENGGLWLTACPFAS
jgi:hypothetical protein